MEYVGGGNLQQYVERVGILPEWLARCFFQQLILALHYCHEQLNIAHRDIKLGNILLNTKYQIPILKICDFGYSKVRRRPWRGCCRCKRGQGWSLRLCMRSSGPPGDRACSRKRAPSDHAPPPPRGRAS